eukprot:351308-Chlamydomonas_euryale.AAC.5
MAAPREVQGCPPSGASARCLWHEGTVVATAVWARLWIKGEGARCGCNCCLGPPLDRGGRRALWLQLLSGPAFGSRGQERAVVATAV